MLANVGHAEQFLLAGRIGRRGGGVAGKLRMALRQIMMASHTMIMASRNGFFSHMSTELVRSRSASLALASFWMSMKPRFMAFS